MRWGTVRWGYCGEYSPTCLASTAAVYSGLNDKSVIETSSNIILKSMARSTNCCRTKRLTRAL